MEITKINADRADFLARLRQLNEPPQQLYCAGANLSELLSKPCLAIVGSRAATPYGRQVTEQLASDCARGGITIISGLAFGVDSFAHQATLDAGGSTIAVLPSGLAHIYPASHRRLAQQITEQGGALVSEYASGAPPQKYQFITRNRLIAGLAQAVLITEAAANSGSLHTAHFAANLGRRVLAVPGNISSKVSQGSNWLIQTGAANLVTSSGDIFSALQLAPTNARASPKSDNPAEQTILNLIEQGVNNGGAILAGSQLNATTYSQSMSMLEIKGHIKNVGGDSWQLRP